MNRLPLATHLNHVIWCGPMKEMGRMGQSKECLMIEAKTQTGYNRHPDSR